MMNDLCETILYIAHNLVKQNQILSLEAFRQILGWAYNNDSALENEVEWLLHEGYLQRKGDREFKFTEQGIAEAFKISKARTKKDFDTNIACGLLSAAYLDYCQEIYGYRMPLFNMMDKEQLDYVFQKILISSGDTILDLGCGTGCILDALVNKYQCHGIGMDILEKPLFQSSSELLCYLQSDIDNLPEIDLRPTITFSIDSLYFSNDLHRVLKALLEVKNNRLYLFYSQYIFDETQKDRALLDGDNSRLASVLQTLGVSYEALDFSENEFLLYKKGLEILPKYKKAFEAEGNSELFHAKLRDNQSGKEMYEKGLASRFLYMVEKGTN